MKPIPVHRVGRGDHPVIVLSGCFGSPCSWGSVADWLDGEHFSYAFMDYRGHGSRLGERGRFSMAEIAQDVLTLADQLGWPEFSLLGHEMGGMAIQRVLADAPERVHRLVGVAPVPASGLPMDPHSMGCYAQAARQPEVRRALLDLLGANRLPGPWLDAQLRQSMATVLPAAFLAYLEAWTCNDFAMLLKGDRHPVLALVGARDPALTEAFVRETWMEAYPRAHIQILPSASHFAAHETPLALVVAVENFLKGL